MMCCRLDSAWITRLVEEGAEEGLEGDAALRTPSMTDLERKDAALPILVFGAPMVDRFYSKNYSDKEAGLLLLQAAMRDYVPDASSTRPERFTRAAVFLIQRSLRDKVYSVAQLACSTLSLLLTQFFPRNRVSRKECGSTLDRVLPDLLPKTADNAVRTQQLAVAAITEMLTFALTRNVSIIGAELSKPITLSVHPRSALCRATIVEAQLTRMAASPLPKDRDTGFTARQLAEFGLSGVQHSSSDVRKASERVLLALYRHHPLAVRRALPHEDEPARRNVLFRNLFEQLDLIDKQRSNNSSPRGRGFGVSDGSPKQGPGRGVAVPTTLALGACSSSGISSGGSSNSSSNSNCSINSINSSGGGSTTSSQLVPQICITPDGSEARGRALCRINSAKDLRCEDDGLMMSQPSPLTPSPAGSQPSPLTPPYLQGDEDNACIFCGLVSNTLSGSGLDVHYWRSCPLLTRCTHCKQVLEIASLSQHLVEECEVSSQYRRCDRCTEAVPRQELRAHVAAASCTAAKPFPLANHCPLCRENIPPWDDGWRAHLLPGPDACPANPRSRYPEQGRNTGDLGRNIADHGRTNGDNGRNMVDNGKNMSDVGRLLGDQSKFPDAKNAATVDHGRGGDSRTMDHSKGTDHRGGDARGGGSPYGTHSLPRSQSSLDRSLMETIGEEEQRGDPHGRGSGGAAATTPSGRGGARTKIATPITGRKTYNARRH